MARNFITKAQGNSSSTTLSASVSDSDTSFPLTSDTAFAGEGMVIIDEGTASEEIAYATGKVGAALTIPLANRGLEGGSAQAHNAGATVKGILTAAMYNDNSTALKNVVSATTGALDTTKVVDLTTAQTLTTKTLTTPKIASIYQDAGGTKLMSLPDTASDTLVSLAATQVLTNKTFTSPLLQGTVDGWISANESWAYASASTITVPAGAAAKYRIGDKIKLTQTTVKYFSVIGVADTVLTVTGGTDYTVANAAISLNYYSHSDPLGFPDWFAFTPSVGAGGSMTFSTTSAEVAKFRVSGRQVTSLVHLLGTTGGSASNYITHTLPVTPVDANNYKIAGACYVYDANQGTGLYQYISSAVQVYKSDLANWTVTTNRRIATTITYAI